MHEDRMLYVVSTYYHALIVCVKQLNKPRPADILVTDYIPEGAGLAARIETGGLFDKVKFIGKVDEYLPKNRLDYVFFFTRSTHSASRVRLTECLSATVKSMFFTTISGRPAT